MGPSTSEDQSKQTTSSAEQPSLATWQAVTVLRPNSARDSDCTSLFEAQSLLTERQAKLIVQAVSHKDSIVLAAILKDHCPSVVEELKKTVVKGVENIVCKAVQAFAMFHLIWK